VEDETLSCGTGVTAVALAMHRSGKTNSDLVKIVTPGGNLQVKFNSNADGYEQIWLTGPAQLVFKGEIHVES
jgi:diaminopimelate epimerase